MRTVTTALIVEPGKNGRQERRYPFVRLRGKWLESYGIKPGSTVYIHEQVNGLLITTESPASIHRLPMPAIENIKAEFRKLGIETEKRVRTQKSTPVSIPAASAVAETPPPKLIPLEELKQLSFSLENEEIDQEVLEHMTLKNMSVKDFRVYCDNY